MWSQSEEYHHQVGVGHKARTESPVQIVDYTGIAINNVRLFSKRKGRTMETDSGETSWKERSAQAMTTPGLERLNHCADNHVRTSSFESFHFSFTTVHIYALDTTHLR